MIAAASQQAQRDHPKAKKKASSFRKAHRQPSASAARMEEETASLTPGSGEQRTKTLTVRAAEPAEAGADSPLHPDPRFGGGASYFAEGECLWSVELELGRTVGALGLGDKLWDPDSGLGGSQRAEVAWLQHKGYKFLRLGRL